MSLEYWADIGTLVIALLALIISIWSIFSQNKHARVGVTPHLIRNVTRNEIDNEIVITISNTGLGPAFIDSCVYEVEGRESSTSFSLIEYVEKIARSNKNNFEIFYSVSEVTEGLVIQAGERFVLFKARYKLLNNYTKEEFDKLFHRIDYSLNYSSIYGNKKSL